METHIDKPIYRRHSGSLFDCSSQMYHTVDKAKELYFLKLEQMNLNQQKSMLRYNDACEKDNEYAPACETTSTLTRTPSIIINKSTRKNSISSSTHGFTEDMAFFADVDGDYSVFGKTEVPDPTSPRDAFIPPHKVQYCLSPDPSFSD